MPQRGEPREPNTAPEEVKARVDLAARLLAAGTTRRQAAVTVARELGCTESAAHAACQTVLRTWADDLTADLPKAKAAQAERLFRDLVRMRSRQEPNFASIARHETLLADLLGTRAPVRIEVDVGLEVRKSLLTVVSGLTAEEQDALVAEQLELESRASGVAGFMSDRSDMGRRGSA